VWYYIATVDFSGDESGKNWSFFGACMVYLIALSCAESGAWIA
jgi:hypothetical protein